MLLPAIFVSGSPFDSPFGKFARFWLTRICSHSEMRLGGIVFLHHWWLKCHARVQSFQHLTYRNNSYKRILFHSKT